MLIRRRKGRWGEGGEETLGDSESEKEKEGAGAERSIS